MYTAKRPTSKKEALRKGRQEWCFVTADPQTPDSFDGKSPFTGIGCSPVTSLGNSSGRVLKSPQSVRTMTYTRNHVHHTHGGPRGHEREELTVSSSSSKTLGIAELLIKEIEQPLSPAALLSSLGVEPISLPLLSAAAAEVGGSDSPIRLPLSSDGEDERTTTLGGDGESQTARGTGGTVVPTWWSEKRPYSSDSSVFLTSKRLLMGSPPKGQRLVLHSKRTTATPPTQRKDTLQQFESLRQTTSSRENHLSRGTTSASMDDGGLGETEPPLGASPDDLRGREDDDGTGSENDTSAQQDIHSDSNSPVRFTISDGNTIVEEVCIDDPVAGTSTPITSGTIIDSRSRGVTRKSVSLYLPPEHQDTRAASQENTPDSDADRASGINLASFAGGLRHHASTSETDSAQGLFGEQENEDVFTISPSGSMMTLSPKSRDPAKQRKSVQFSIGKKSMKKIPSSNMMIRIQGVEEDPENSGTTNMMETSRGSSTSMNLLDAENSGRSTTGSRRLCSFGSSPGSPRVESGGGSKKPKTPASSFKSNDRRRSTMTKKIEEVTTRNLADVEHPFGYFSKAVEEMGFEFGFEANPEEHRHLKRLVTDLKHTDLCRRFGQFHPLPALPDHTVRHLHSNKALLQETPATKGLYLKRQQLLRESAGVATIHSKPPPPASKPNRQRLGTKGPTFSQGVAATVGGSRILTSEEELGIMMTEAKEEVQRRNRAQSTSGESTSSGHPRSRSPTASIASTSGGRRRGSTYSTTSSKVASVAAARPRRKNPQAKKPKKKKKRQGASWTTMEEGEGGWDWEDSDDSGNSDEEDDGSGWIGIGPKTEVSSTPPALGDTTQNKILPVMRMTLAAKSPSRGTPPLPTPPRTPRAHTLRPPLETPYTQGRESPSLSATSLQGNIGSTIGAIQPQQPKQRRKDNPFHERYLRLDKLENDSQQVGIQDRVSGYVLHLKAIGMLK